MSTQQITLDDTIRLAVQRDLENKSGSTRAHGYGWQNETMSLYDLWQHITKSGHAFCTAELTNNHRHSDNFKQAWGILIDLDENSLKDAQNDPYLRTIATAGFTTPSHTQQAPRCKIVSVFDKPVTDAALFRQYVELVMSKIKTVTVDASGKDCVRFSYGSKGGQWLFIGNVLHVDVLHAELAEKAKAVREQQKAIKPKPLRLKTRKHTTSTDETLLSELSRHISDKLGVSSYTNNQSHHVTCPCGHHKNGDNDPSAVWNRDTKTLYCYTNAKTYNAIQTAQLLGIDLAKMSTARRGLWNSTRSKLLNHSYKNDKGTTIKPLTSFCRFLDAMIMYGVQPGWYTIKELDAALNGLFSDRTLRYSIASNLLSSSEFYRLKAENTSDSGLICICVLLLENLSLSSKVDKNANYLTVPEPVIPDTGHKPSEYYFVPTEQELQKALGIERGTKHDYLDIQDLKSNGTYTKAIVRVAIEQRPGQTKKTLNKVVGRTGRTINRIVKDTPTLQGKRNEKALGQVTDDIPLPIEPDFSKYLMAVDTRTGELTPKPFCLSAYLYSRKFTDKIYAYQHVATTYYPIKETPLTLGLAEDTQELDKTA